MTRYVIGNNNKNDSTSHFLYTSVCKYDNKYQKEKGENNNCDGHAHALAAVHEGFRKSVFSPELGVRNSIYEPATATNPVSAWNTVSAAIDWTCPANSCATPHASM
ncbi:hypothetical protein V6N13_111728 [Hibiscus sabdariffa]|uniref:Uncharacterized protein n=1 Tax=Hibiscus sabdariffa TaxID=183260 RepID=A0ABR2TLL9_9ROSI